MQGSKLYSMLAVQVLDTLAEINERHEAVKELEKSLMELHQIFLDMAVLVEAQGEMLDNIEQQVRLHKLPLALHLVLCRCRTKLSNRCATTLSNRCAQY